MKAIATISPTLTLELEAKDHKELFEEMAVAQEIFGHSKCGKCQSSDVKYVTREVDDYKFYEVHCNKCHARLSFGVNKKGGTLFPKRKDADGKYIENNGWTVYQQKQEKQTQG
jgi:hypothetical protein